MSNERIDRLEERLAWFERHVTEQDKVMMELAEELSRLRGELLAMRARGDAGGSGELLSGDERPPHY